MTRSAYVADELLILAKEAGVKETAGRWAKGVGREMLPVSGKQWGSIKRYAKAISKKPGLAKNLPRHIARLGARGFKEGFKGNKLWAGLHGLAVADPVIRTVSALRHPETPHKLRSIGESLGGTAGWLLHSRAPILGQMLSSEVGRRAGGAVGGAAEKAVDFVKGKRRN
jgi:hypothetical protein